MRRGTGRFLALVAGGSVALVALVLVLVFARGGASRTAASDGEAGPPPSAFTPVPVSLPATGPAAATSVTPADSAGPSGSASAAASGAPGGKIRRPKPGAGHGTPRGSAAGAPDLDSRF